MDTQAPTATPAQSAPKTPAAPPSSTPTPETAQAAARPGAPPDTPKGGNAPEPKPEPRKLKVKVNGAEREVPEDELVRRYQMEESANQRFEEAAKLRKEAETERAAVRKFFEAVKQDPKAFFSDPRIGVDVKKFAQELLAAEIKAQMAAEEEKTLSPDQRRLRELEKELSERKARDTKADEDKQSAARKESVEKHRQSFETQIIEALEAAPHLPKDAETAELVLGLIEQNARQGRPHDVTDVVDRLDRSIHERFGRYVKALGPTKAAKAIDADIRKALREMDVEELKKANPMAFSQPQVAKKGGPEVRKAEPPRVRKSAADLQRDLGDRDWDAYLQKQAKRAPDGRFK
jgi:hypothetical protein